MRGLDRLAHRSGSRSEDYLTARCLEISYSEMPTAMDALSDSMAELIGMETIWWQFLRTSRPRPVPSEPPPAQPGLVAGTGAAAGGHISRVRSIGGAGNVDPSPATASFVFANASPVGTFTVTPDGGAANLEVTAQFRSTAEDHDLPDDERLWVPQAPNVWFRPLLFNTVNGEWVHFLRVTRAGLLSRLRHPPPVHVYVIRCSCRSFVPHCFARAAIYIFYPPAPFHSLFFFSYFP